MKEREPERFEPWAWFAFALALGTAALFLYLGTRPGGEAARAAYRYGPLVGGGAAAVFLLGALIHCLRRRPVLQRRRTWPLAALGVSLWFCSLPIAYPSAHEGKYSPTAFRLPFEGAARVRFGGEERRSNPLLFDPSRRFGLCFEPLAPERPLRVVAPCAGELVAVFEGRTGVGLVIRSGPQEYCTLEGLDGPPEAEVGAVLAPGQGLGRTSARLVLALADQPGPGRGEGIPVRFRDYRLEGREVELGVPTAGQALEAPPADG